MSWKTELADLLDGLGTREKRLNGKPVTFINLDELVFQLRRADENAVTVGGDERGVSLGTYHHHSDGTYERIK